MQSGKEKNQDSGQFEITDPDLQSSVDQGVMGDHLSAGRITFWTIATSIVVVVLIVIAFQLYKYFKFQQEFNKAVNVEYRELNNHRAQAIEQLNEISVVDEDAGIFRIPIDSAKTLLIRSRE